MFEWFSELFGVAKPVIAMAHLPALPGTPRYDPALWADEFIDRIDRDVTHLLAGGVDAIMSCNEDDRPYALKADFEAIAVMTRVITELRPADRPFGVDFLWDARAAIADRESDRGCFHSGGGYWCLRE